MAEEREESAGIEQEEPKAPSEPPQPRGERGEGTDWKAEARKWERLAKGNKEKAEALAAAEARLQELEAARAKAEGEAEERGRQIERMGALAAVAEEKGVPASLLKGETREEMEASADSLLRFAESITPRFPEDTGGPATDAGPADPESIKDPVARLRARAELARTRQ